MRKELVVITGASSGIGAATARLFSSLGHPLLLLARRIEKLNALALPNAICAQVDIKDASAVEKAITGAVEKYGPVGCLVNNAGEMFLDFFGNQSNKEWEGMIQTNILGTFNTVHAVVNSMKDQKTGTIINISSIAGHKSINTASVYCATKHAINAFSETLRAELAEHNVRVITISPGGVKTDLHTHMENKEIMQGYAEWIKNIQLLSPDELADMIVYSYKLPQHICLRQIIIAPTTQAV